MSDPLKAWIDSPSFIVMSRLASIAAVIIGLLGTSVASLAVWIFLRAADDLADVSKGMAGLVTKVAVHETQIGDLRTEQFVLRKSMEQIRARVSDVAR